ncbi:hypothetical protein HAX54_006888, partial [Datura stramonium]|nr:hypothetical protein [Datura stramonium]
NWKSKIVMGSKMLYLLVNVLSLASDISEVPFTSDVQPYDPELGLFPLVTSTGYSIF